MQNIKKLRINLHSKQIEANWDLYQKRYLEIEAQLQKPLTLLFSTNLKKYIHSTGSFQINSKEYELIDDKLKNFFETDQSVIRMKTKIIFRGKNYYPGLYEDLNDESKFKLIFSEINEIKSSLSNLDLKSNLILFLVLADYLKNYYLIILNAFDESLRTVCPNDIDDKIYFNLIETIQRIEYCTFKSINDEVIHWDKDILNYNIRKIEKHLLEISKLKIVFNKPLIRNIRECNHIIKILDFANRISDEYLPRNTLLVSFAYGGIELPFSINALRAIRGKSTLPICICRLSNYSSGTIDKIQDLSDTLSHFYSEKYIEQFENIMILDDSITTGKTIQNFVDLLPNKLKKLYLGIVSFKNSNRYHHLVMPYHGGVNPEVLKNAVITSTSNFAKTYKKFSYTNKNGVFDKEKTKIYKLLNIYK